jgi:uncharacterized protein
LSEQHSGPGSLPLAVGDLLSEPGRRRAVDGPQVLEELSVGSGGIAGGTVELQLLLEAQAGQILVSGVVRASWDLECRRCLLPISVPVEPALTEIFEDSPTEGETFPLVGEMIDLAPMLREAVLLTLPLAPLCGPDCRGPAEGAYYGPDSTDDGPATPGRDQRWAALDDFRPDEG